MQYDSVNISVDAVSKETLKLARGYTRLEKLIENIEWYCTQFKADEINQNGAEWAEDLLVKLYDMDVELCPDAELYPTEEEIDEAAKELGIWNESDKSDN